MEYSLPKQDWKSTAAPTQAVKFKDGLCNHLRPQEFCVTFISS